MIKDLHISWTTLFSKGYLSYLREDYSRHTEPRNMSRHKRGNLDDQQKYEKKLNFINNHGHVY